MRGKRTLASVGFIPLLLLGTACGKSGGGGSSPTAADPNTPVITNLRVSFGARCTLPSNLPGTIETLAFEYTDADGNVRGGTLENTASAAVGGSITLTPPIPSPGVTITGTTSGTVTVTGCLHFGSNASVTEQVKVIDASGKASNVLKLEVPRPAGAPLLPRDADPASRKSLEFGR
ncbi:MAG: hypothetical protein ACRELA_06750 [Candidatus Rokuibacteriota bacterium]